MAEEEENSPVCECGKAHENDYYPEQCPKCEKWFVGQCASDNLIYTDDDDSVPCSCLECEKQEERLHEEGQAEGGVAGVLLSNTPVAERLHEEEEEISNKK